LIRIRRNGSNTYYLVIFHDSRLAHITTVNDTRAATLIDALTIINLGPEAIVNIYLTRNSRFHRVSIGIALKMVVGVNKLFIVDLSLHPVISATLSKLRFSGGATYLPFTLRVCITSN